MKADVVIVGGGIMGMSIAYQLSRRCRMKIVVVEKGAGLGEGSTGASSAICRFRYSLDDMVLLARDGINAYQHWGEFLKLRTPRTGLRRVGVLWMPGDDQTWAQQEHKRMSSMGIHTEILDSQTVTERFPGINPCVIAADLETGEAHECRGGGRYFFEPDGGYVDPVAAIQDLLEASRREGVDVRFNSEVKRIVVTGSRAAGVELQTGEVIQAGTVISAAGPWTNRLIATTDLELPWTLCPTRIQALYVDMPAQEIGPLPACVDMLNGIYFRPQNGGQQIVLGSTLEKDEQELVDDPDHFDRLVDQDFQMAKLHALHHRLPKLPYKGKVRGYSGLYTVNQEDVHPIVGYTKLEGLVIAAGFSGHGFKIAPAVGSLVAQMFTSESLTFDTNVSFDFLSPKRTPHKLDSMSVLA